MNPLVLDDLVAVAKDEDAIEGALGYIVWFSVPDRPVKLNKLRVCWLAAGLDEDPLPADPRALYLFKRAMREQEGRVKQPDGTVVQTDVQPVLENNETCIYQISRVVRDLEEQVVDYPKAMRVVYDKRLEDVRSFEKLGPDVSKEDLAPMILAIQEYMEVNTKVVDGRKVRTLVRNFLKDQPDERHVGLGGENLRGKAGGVYFVAVEHKDQLQSLAEALEKLYADEAENYGVCTVPLADGASEREMVRAAHVANTLKEIDEAMTDAKRLLREDRKNAIRSDVVLYHAQRLKAIQRRSATYRQILQDEDDVVGGKIEILGKQLEKLVGQAAA